VSPVPRIPPGYAGPALFSYGFRPFFLFGAAWAAAAVLLWILQWYGKLTLPTAFTALDWHIHAMLYGYVPAVVAGFLLTAIPNWTGRLPLAGRPLILLFSLWVAGRIAVLGSSLIGEPVAALIDIAFLLALGGAACREIVAGRNWRNLRVLIVLAMLAAGNIVFHLEVALRGVADYGVRIGIAAAIALIMLVGGRIVPSFTHNWLARRASTRLPRSFSRYDAAAITLAAAALLSWIVRPTWLVTGILLVVAGAAHIGRLARWAGERTFADRLVLVLHVGYAFVPLGFVLTGIAAVRPDWIAMSAGIHAWTAGAVGVMTLAVMTRASLGHTGSALVASRGTELVYAMVVISAVSRIAAAQGTPALLLEVAASAWIAGFAGFVVAYGPNLVRPRASRTISG
jgi:uncharacterized protein involved in response to NO